MLKCFFLAIGLSASVALLYSFPFEQSRPTQVVLTDWEREVLGPLPMDTLPPLFAEVRHVAEVQATVALLSRLHYKGVDLDDSLSAAIFERFMESLDGSKLYFTAEEVEKLTKAYQTDIDDMIKAGELQAFYDMFARYRDRALGYATYAKERIKEPFDFQKEEYLNANIKDRPRSQDLAELHERWRKTLKNELLELTLSGKTDSAARAVIVSRRNSMERWLKRVDKENVFQEFMNALTRAYDPHSGYFSALMAENFNIEMSKSLEGIGASLRQDGEYTTINSLVPGGPAYKSKQLEVSDRIVGVAQGDTGTYVDVVGWRISEVVQLIRGKKGTSVRLFILPADTPPTGKPKVVEIVRDRIELEDAVAKAKVYDIERKGKPYKLGVIALPSFYVDWKAVQMKKKNYRSASQDVRRLLDSLKQSGVDGVAMDLRGNGGGALSEAINLSGLFIKKGPIVQIEDFRGRVVVRNDNDPMAYDGPLVVLLDRFSASATEIMAGSIQDYGRGLLVGEPTFGKGSVQNILELKDYLPSAFEKNGEVGQLKLTFAQYYRVNGESTQTAGVVPDIVLPSRFGDVEFREASMPGALAWKKIDAVKSRYDTPESKELITKRIRNQINKSFKKDLKTPPWVGFAKETKRYRKNRENRGKLSLSYDVRKKEQESLLSDTSKAKVKDKDPLAKDHYLREGLFLLADLSEKIHENKAKESRPTRP